MHGPVGDPGHNDDPIAGVHHDRSCSNCGFLMCECPTITVSWDAVTGDVRDETQRGAAWWAGSGEPANIADLCGDYPLDDFGPTGRPGRLATLEVSTHGVDGPWKRVGCITDIALRFMRVPRECVPPWVDDNGVPAFSVCLAREDYDETIEIDISMVTDWGDIGQDILTRIGPVFARFRPEVAHGATQLVGQFELMGWSNSAKECDLWRTRATIRFIGEPQESTQ